MSRRTPQDGLNVLARHLVDIERHLHALEDELRLLSMASDEGKAVEGRLHEVWAVRDELKAAIEDLRQVIR